MLRSGHMTWVSKKCRTCGRNFNHPSTVRRTICHDCRTHATGEQLRVLYTALKRKGVI